MATDAQRLAQDRHFSEATDGRSTITRLLLLRAPLPERPVPLLKQPDKLAKRAAFVLTQMHAAGLPKGVTSAELPTIPALTACGGS